MGGAVIEPYPALPFARARPQKASYELFSVMVLVLVVTLTAAISAGAVALGIYLERKWLRPRLVPDVPSPAAQAVKRRLMRYLILYAVGLVTIGVVVGLFSHSVVIGFLAVVAVVIILHFAALALRARKAMRER